MENSPELEFEYFLAQKLGMTRAALVTEMGSDEFLGWEIYYGRKAQQAELARLKGGG